MNETPFPDTALIVRNGITHTGAQPFVLLISSVSDDKNVADTYQTKREVAIAQRDLAIKQLESFLSDAKKTRKTRKNTGAQYSIT